MRGILKGNDDFQRFSSYCEEKENIEKELKNTKMHGKKERNLRERLIFLKKGILELRKMLQKEIKVS
jgi:hypothetical protein